MGLIHNDNNQDDDDDDDDYDNDDGDGDDDDRQSYWLCCRYNTSEVHDNVCRVNKVYNRREVRKW